MPYRKTALERFDEEIRSCLVSLNEIGQADQRLLQTLEKLRALDDQMRDLQSAELRVLHELERLASMSWASLYNSVLGTMDDVQKIEMDALMRIQEKMNAGSLERQRLRVHVEILLAKCMQRQISENARQHALNAKAAWLRTHDPQSSERLVELNREECKLRLRLSDIERRMITWKGGYTGEWQTTAGMRFLRGEVKRIHECLDALATERNAILLDGIDTAASMSQTHKRSA